MYITSRGHGAAGCGWLLVSSSVLGSWCTYMRCSAREKIFDWFFSLLSCFGPTAPDRGLVLRFHNILKKSSKTGLQFPKSCFLLGPILPARWFSAYNFYWYSPSRNRGQHKQSSIVFFNHKWSFLTRSHPPSLAHASIYIYSAIANIKTCQMLWWVLLGGFDGQFQH